MDIFRTLQDIFNWRQVPQVSRSHHNICAFWCLRWSWRSHVHHYTIFLWTTAASLPTSVKAYSDFAPPGRPEHNGLYSSVGIVATRRFSEVDVNTNRSFLWKLSVWLFQQTLALSCGPWQWCVAHGQPVFFEPQPFVSAYIENYDGAVGIKLSNTSGPCKRIKERFPRYQGDPGTEIWIFPCYIWI